MDTPVVTPTSPTGTTSTVPLAGPSPPTTIAPDTTDATLPEIPDDLAAFGIETIVVAGEEWLVAVADTGQEKGDGLRGILEMGDVDGMLFSYDEPTTVAFTMRAVTQPLEIAFFAADGSLINVLEMTPCADDPECPVYRSEAPFRWALESFPGGAATLSPDAVIVPD